MKTLDVNLILGRPGTHDGGVLTAKELLAEMDRQNIERGFVTHLAGAVHNPVVGNEMLFRDIPNDAGARLVPVPAMSLWDPPDATTWSQWETAGVRGIRICPSFYGPARGPRVGLELMDNLGRRGWFLQVPISPFCGCRWPTSTVAEAVSFAAMREDVLVPILCPGRKQFGELLAGLASRPNVYVDVGNLSTGTGVSQLVAAGFAERLICGSGYGVSCITAARDIVLYAHIPETAKTAILCENAARLMGP